MLDRTCLRHPAMFLPLVLVPVATIVVSQTTSIPTLERLQFEVDAHLMSLHLVRLVEAFIAIFTAKPFIAVRLVNVVQVLLHVLHHQPTNSAGGAGFVSSVPVFLQMDPALEDFPANIAGGSLAVFSVIVIEESTVRVKESVALAARHRHFLCCSEIISNFWHRKINHDQTRIIHYNTTLF